MADQNIVIQDSNGNTTFRVKGNAGEVTVGGNEKGGTVFINDAAKMHRLAFNGNDGSLSVRNAAGKDSFKVMNNGSVEVGAKGTPGTLMVFDDKKVLRTLVTGGLLNLMDDAGKVTLSFTPQDSKVRVGGSGRDGIIKLLNKAGVETISIQGSDGDIVLQGADCAEEFEVACEAEPGSVLVLDDDGRLELSRKAYDSRVAGVVSGAGAYQPGIILGRSLKTSSRVPLALVGRVMCFADATKAPIRTGDLLTTAAGKPGHAMKASDRRRALGTLLGKALAPLPNGRGLIPILVALQ